MYDFHFGSKEEIQQRDEDFLIFVKRLLPRWINGIPDSECLAIYRSLKEIDSPEPVLLETGCGASTLALFLYAALNKGKVFSWDTNGSKGNFLRSVISEAICLPLEIDLHKIWTFVAFDSTSRYAGIPIIKEMKLEGNYCYFDSWHTLEHLMNEVKSFEEIASKDFIIALDDAYYTKRKENYSFINMIRKKLKLSPVEEPEDNLCDPFYEEIERYLKGLYTSVIKIEDTYKIEFKEDIFFNYYEQDKKSMEKVGMEESKNLPHRFDAWKIRR
tara:strand:+ start:1715 stop:2530 length:816 start_codon:yes stop_codon:yes gene_type:complete